MNARRPMLEPSLQQECGSRDCRRFVWSPAPERTHCQHLRMLLIFSFAEVPVFAVFAQRSPDPVENVWSPRSIFAPVALDVAAKVAHD